MRALRLSPFAHRKYLRQGIGHEIQPDARRSGGQAYETGPRRTQRANYIQEGMNQNYRHQLAKTLPIEPPNNDMWLILTEVIPRVQSQPSGASDPRKFPVR